MRQHVASHDEMDPTSIDFQHWHRSFSEIKTRIHFDHLSPGALSQLCFVLLLLKTERHTCLQCSVSAVILSLIMWTRRRRRMLTKPEVVLQELNRWLPLLLPTQIQELPEKMVSLCDFWIQACCALLIQELPEELFFLVNLEHKPCCALFSPAFCSSLVVEMSLLVANHLCGILKPWDKIRERSIRL